MRLFIFNLLDIFESLDSENPAEAIATQCIYYSSWNALLKKHLDFIQYVKRYRIQKDFTRAYDIKY